MAAVLNLIPERGDWRDIANRTNQNFSKLNAEIDKAQKIAGITIPLFSSTTQATQHIPNPSYGQMVFIGTGLPAPVYIWSGTRWTSAGFSGGSTSVSLGNYYTKKEIDSQKVFVKNTTEVVI